MPQISFNQPKPFFLKHDFVHLIVNQDFPIWPNTEVDLNTPSNVKFYAMAIVTIVKLPTTGHYLHTM